MSEDDAYRLYLERFEQAVGHLEAGACTNHNGRMIKKLTREEFGPKWREFVELRAAHENMLANGFTIDNAVLVELRKMAADLIAVLPPQFM
jgi:hypothetical protein